MVVRSRPPIRHVHASLVLALAGFTVGASATAQVCEWSELRIPAPSPRQNHGMVYASGLGVTILYGGRGYGPGDDTWLWDGNAWSLIPDPGPPARYGHAMAYDSARNVVVLFGGLKLDYSEYFGDTWEWDGERWYEVSAPGPSPRNLASMAFDSSRGVMVLFGGQDNVREHGDTWEWDGNGWTEVSRSGPTARAQSAMVFDSFRNVCVIFGGQHRIEGAFGDTWAWNGVQWTLLASEGPDRRWGHAMAFDRSRGVTVLFAGASGNNDNETWEWDGERWIQGPDRGPQDRRNHAMVYHESLAIMMVFGGYGFGSVPRDDTWIYTCYRERVLSIDSACPTGGPSRILWSGCEPRALTAIVYSPDLGSSFRIPNGMPCEGLLLDLYPSGIQLIWSGRSSDTGAGSLSGIAPRRVCGDYLQMVDLQACRKSNYARIE